MGAKKKRISGVASSWGGAERGCSRGPSYIAWTLGEKMGTREAEKLKTGCRAFLNVRKEKHSKTYGEGGEIRIKISAPHTELKEQNDKKYGR